MKELTKEQREQIENFKKHIAELVEKQKVSWIIDVLERDDYSSLYLNVLAFASRYFLLQEIPFTFLYDEITDFCFEKYIKPQIENLI